MSMIKPIKVIPCSPENELFIQKNGHFLLNLKVENVESKINEHVVLFIADILKIDKRYISIQESQIKHYKLVKIKKNYFKPKSKQTI